MSRGRLPLEGFRVLDYGQYVAAPFATMLLGDLGADVVKVEPPHGDEWRRYEDHLAPLKAALGPVLETYPDAPASFLQR